MNLKNEVVLIIGSDAPFRTTIRKVLENAGAAVWDTGIAKDALVLFDRHSPHLIIIDLDFDAKEAAEFHAARSASPALNEVPLITWSAKGDSASVQRAIQWGSIDFIAKPFKATVLLQKIRKLQVKRSENVLQAEFTEALKARATIPAKIIKLNEESAVVGCAARLVSEKPIDIHSALFKSMGLGQPLFKVWGPSRILEEENQYVTRLRFYGLREDQLKEIQKVIRLWK